MSSVHWKLTCLHWDAMPEQLDHTLKEAKRDYLQIFTVNRADIYVMYKLRVFTSCNSYKESVQVATCTSKLYNLQRVQDCLYKL